MDEHVAHELPKAEGEPGVVEAAGVTEAADCGGEGEAVKEQVGPLRPVHLELLRRNDALLLAQEQEVREIEAQLAAARRRMRELTASAIDAILQDLGAERGQRDAWLTQQDGQTYVALGRWEGRREERNAMERNALRKSNDFDSGAG